jgi:hypothetical protein
MPESVGNTELAFDNIKEEILVGLGGTSLDVELDEADVEKCIKDTVRIYNRNRPGRGHKSLSVVSEQKRYELAAADHKGIQGVVAVGFVEKTNFTGDPFDPFYYNALGLTPQGDTFGEYDQRRQSIEMYRRIGSVEPEWSARVENGIVVLYIDIASPYHCMYTYTFHYTPDTDAATGLLMIPSSDVDWFMRHTTALAKQIVGRKRSKFGGILIPDGGSAETDGRELKDEAKEELTLLLEEIKKRRRPLIPEIE